jgi:hypothetical protein
MLFVVGCLLFCMIHYDIVNRYITKCSILLLSTYTIVAILFWSVVIYSIVYNSFLAVMMVVVMMEIVIIDEKVMMMMMMMMMMKK